MQTLTLPRTPDDGRDYQLLRSPGGLLCLLVREPHADAAGCVFQFGVGSHDEPSEWPGLAHLLEHMLFMGSADHPQPGSFPQLVSQWSGRFNASTAPERTRYHFSVNPAGLEPCLAQLTDMLVAPLFAADAVEAERQVIDAEFHTRLADAALHEQAVLACVVQPDHPLSRFSAGNARSLAGEPRVLAQALRQFHVEHYRAGNGCLLMHAPQPMKELVALAQRAAERLPTGPAAQRTEAASLLAPQKLPGMLRWQSPGREQPHLLLFELEGVHTGEGQQAVRWLCEWLASPAPAGGLGWLRHRGLAAELRVDVQRYRNKRSLLRLEIEPLDRAEEPVGLLNALFSWLAALRATPSREWPQAARQQLEDQAFAAGPQGELLPWLASLGERLLHEPAEQILESIGRWAGLEEGTWRNLLDQLEPARLLLACSQQGEAGLPQRAPWTDTAYRYEPLHVPLAPTWNDSLNEADWPVWSPAMPEQAARTESDPIPGVREIPVPYRLAAAEGTGSETTRIAWCWPVEQLDRDQGERLQALWSLQLEPLNNWMSATGIRHLWSNSPGVISLELQGPSQSLPLGLVAALEALKAPDDEALQRLAEHRYQTVMKERDHALPAYRLLDELDALICRGTPHSAREAAATQPAGHPQIAWLYPAAWAAGERQPVAAALASLRVAHAFRWHPPAPRRLGQGTEAIEVGCRHADRAQILYCQGDSDSVADLAGWQLLHQHISASFFDQLRTRRQLGYWVVARYHEVAGVPGLILLVQSPSHDHEAISNAIDEWLASEHARLSALPFAQVQSQARRLADHLRTQVQSDAGRSELAWARALSLPYATVLEQCAALEQLTTEQWSQVREGWLEKPRRLHLLSRQI
ncbi:insulinase family protein [Halopseudomonas pertucinogena]|nr:insulinase family protein [Halopseudomonas pertucinogena]